MAWTVSSSGVWTHAGTNRDTVAGPGTLSGVGQVTLRCAQKSGNVKAWVYGTPNGRTCWEAGVEGANAVIRRVDYGTPAAASATAAHGLAASTPYTIDVRLTGTTITVYLNGDFATPLTSYDTALDAGRDLSQQTGYGWVSAVNSAVVLAASTEDLKAINVPSAKMLVAIGGGELWIMPSKTSGLKKIAGGVAVPNGPVRVAEYRGTLDIVDGAGNHKKFDALTEVLSAWTRSGSPPTFGNVQAFQDRVYGVPQVDANNLYASAVSDDTDYDTGSSLPGAAFAFDLAKLPKIGEPVLGLAVTTNTAMTAGCPRSIWEIRGDPALGGVSVVALTEGIGITGKDAMFLGSDGRVIAHTTEGLCLLAGGVQHISQPVLTEFIQIDGAADSRLVQTRRDTKRHTTTVFMTPNDGINGGFHVVYDERVGGWDATAGGFFIEPLPARIGPTASVDWDGLLVLGGTDGYLRVYDDAVKDYDGEPIQWRLPLFLAQDDLAHDVIMTDLVVTRGEDSDDFDILIYGGRTAEEAAVGPNRTLLLRKRCDQRVTPISATVRAPALAAELIPAGVGTAGIFESAEMTYTIGEISRFARIPAAQGSHFAGGLIGSGTQGYGGGSNPPIVPDPSVAPFPSIVPGLPHPTPTVNPTDPTGTSRPGVDPSIIPAGGPTELVRPGSGPPQPVGAPVPIVHVMPSPTDPIGNVSPTGVVSGARPQVILSTPISGGGTTGWTSPTPSADSLIVYVNALTGNDSTALTYTTAQVGPDPKQPIIIPQAFATVEHAYAAMRDGHYDWCLFARGQTHSITGNTANFKWAKKGPTSSQPHIVWWYGGSGDRPVLQHPIGTVGIWMYSDNSTTGGNIAFLDLDVTLAPVDIGNSADSVGFEVSGNYSNVRIEGCRALGHFLNFKSTSPSGWHPSEIDVNRCQFLDASYTAGSDFLQNVKTGVAHGIRFTETVMDRAGYGSAVSVFRHNYYGDPEDTGTLLTRCISSRGWNATQMRGGGIADDCLFLDNGNSLFVAHGNNTETNRIIRNCVVIGAKDPDNGTSTPFLEGCGLELIGTNGGLGGTNLKCYNNIVTGYGGVMQSTDNIKAFGIGGSSGDGVFVTDAEFYNNIVYQWDNAGNADTTIGFTGVSCTGISIHNNDIQQTNGGAIYHLTGTPVTFSRLDGNNYSTPTANPYDGTSFATWRVARGDTSLEATQSYFDPARNIATYLTSKGITPGADPVDTFLTGARNNWRLSWDPTYTAKSVNDYIRFGFGRVM